MNPNSVALFKIATMVGELPAHQEIPTQTMQNVLEIIKEQSNISRYTFWQIHEQSQECVIVAGVPAGEHGINKKYLITKHPDILFIVNSPENFNLIKNPYENELTDYFRDVIEGKKINAIGYFQVFHHLPKNDEKKDKKIMGVLVADACGEKNIFEPYELELCQRAARLIASRLVSFEDFLLVLYNEWEDAVRNPTTAIGGLIRRLEKMLETKKTLNWKEKIKEYVKRFLGKILGMAGIPNREEEMKGYLQRINKEIERMEKNI